MKVVSDSNNRRQLLVVTAGIVAYNIWFASWLDQVLSWIALTVILVYNNLRLPQGSRTIYHERKTGAIVGHRGMRVPEHAENSLTALEQALLRGAHGVEIDVRLTKDNKVIVFHDNFLSRLMECDDNTKAVSDLSYEDIQEYRYRGFDEGVPLLSEVLELMRQFPGRKIFIELKTDFNVKVAMLLSKLTLEQIKDQDTLAQCVIISFDPLSLYATRRYHSTIPTCMLVEDGHLSYLEEMKELHLPVPKLLLKPADLMLTKLCHTILPHFIGATMVGPDAKFVCRDYVESWNESGLTVYVWVAKTTAQIETLHEAGAWVAIDSFSLCPDHLID